MILFKLNVSLCDLLVSALKCMDAHLGCFDSLGILELSICNLLVQTGMQGLRFLGLCLCLADATSQRLVVSCELEHLLLEILVFGHNTRVQLRDYLDR